MSKVKVHKIEVQNPKDSFQSNIEIEIMLEALEPLKEGCADNAQYDQVLEEFIVPPLPRGIFKRGKQIFELSVSPPDPDKLPSLQDILGATVIMFTLLYRRQEFFRQDKNSKSNVLNLEEIGRSILIDHPKIHVYEILWDYPGLDTSNTQINGKIKKCKTPRKKIIKKEKQQTKKLNNKKSKNKKKNKK